ncbi:MAG: hypothetical protein EP330_27450 [Deltaproteobacteria bacterium]|nr:MAG: hypothetical protein EP330_27450 [Deltaproteobacteria bacterium]
MRARMLFVAMIALTACKNDNGFTEQPVPPGEPRPESLEAVPAPVPPSPRFYLLFPTTPAAVSDLGHVLLWEWETGGDTYIWTEDEGLEWKTTTGAYFNTVHDISADGTKIIGDYGNYMNDEDTQAATWTEEDGWVKLGALPDTLDCPMQSAGYALSADGTLAAGLAFSGCSGRGFLWDADGGMVATEPLGNGGNRISAMSRNGELMAGFAQGDGSRTPAVWYEDGTGEVLNMAFPGEFYGVNDAGTKAVGQLGSKAAVWDVVDGHTLLGTVGSPGASSAAAHAFCGGDDQMIIGRDSLAGGVAIAWTESTGLVMLQDLLEDFGVEFPDQTRLLDAVACTPDRTHIIGRGAVGEDVGSYVIVLPEGALDPLFQ